MQWLVDYGSTLVLLLAAAIPMGALYKDLGATRFAVLICMAFAIELPAAWMQGTGNDCIADHGPSCVAGAGWMMVFYQIIALPLIFVAWRWLRRGAR